MQAVVAVAKGNPLQIKNWDDLLKPEVRITQASTEGWCTFEQSLCAAFERREITEETAMLLSVNKSRMRQMMDRLKKTLGADETTSAGLKLASEEIHQRKNAASPALPSPELSLRNAM